MLSDTKGGVMARSHKDKIIRALKKEPHEKASYAKLARALGGDWTVEKVQAKVRELEADDDTPICVVKGGVQYFGCETGKKPGFYKEVRRGIERRWGKDNSMRNIAVEHTSRTSAKGSGKWTQPDLVARVNRRKDANPEIVFLAIEVEQPGGFDVVSVYQAYEFGRGADFSWVFYTGPKCTGPTWRQVEVAARDLGVGIVHAARPTAPADWDTVIDAKIRKRKPGQHATFLVRSGLTAASFVGGS